jgi:hypothetical protein
MASLSGVQDILEEAGKAGRRQSSGNLRDQRQGLPEAASREGLPEEGEQGKMSIFTGRQYKGAMRDYRREKREEAERRNAATPPERRRSYRRKTDGKNG